MHSCQYDFTLPASPHFSWLGQTRFQGTLAPLGSMHIEAVALFYSPGRYDLNKWKMGLKMELAIEKSSKPPQPTCAVQLPTISQFVTVI
jgi:hypothetical protein